jgi:hypothetical protein
MKALEDIGKKAKTNDVLFIFFAGHGVMQGADNTFTFLTADASKLNPVGISTTDLKSWLSPEGPFHMMPNKTVLVYDACNSGQAAKEIMADLAMARDDDATERDKRDANQVAEERGDAVLPGIGGGEAEEGIVEGADERGQRRDPEHRLGDADDRPLVGEPEDETHEQEDRQAGRDEAAEAPERPCEPPLAAFARRDCLGERQLHQRKAEGEEDGRPKVRHV